MDFLPLQGYLRNTLGNWAPLKVIIGTRLYDRVPAEVQFPYVSFGPCDGIDATIGCSNAWEITQTIDVWSRAVGFPEAKRACAEIGRALGLSQPFIPTVRTALLRVRTSRVLRDPDGLTSHGIVEVRAIYGPLT
jgi:hypothetical protein